MRNFPVWLGTARRPNLKYTALPVWVLMSTFPSSSARFFSQLKSFRSIKTHLRLDHHTYVDDNAFIRFWTTAKYLSFWIEWGREGTMMYFLYSPKKKFRYLVIMFRKNSRKDYLWAMYAYIRVGNTFVIITSRTRWFIFSKVGLEKEAIQAIFHS